jgi:hypothetical protein
MFSLLGNIVDCEYRVKVLKRMNNIAHSENSFNMEPDELIKVYQWASSKELDVIGSLSFAFRWCKTIGDRLEFYAN